MEGFAGRQRGDRINLILFFEISPYLTGNTLRLSYKAQPVNAV
jgi:hypothetical protein